MLTPLPFVLQATQACVPHAELAQIEALASQLSAPPSPKTRPRAARLSAGDDVRHFPLRLA